MTETEENIICTIPELLNRTVKKYPNRAALVSKNSDGVNEAVTFTQYKEKVCKIAKAFIKLGLEPGQSVGILAFNSPEWFYSEMAAIHAGGIGFGMYLTNSAEVVAYQLNNSDARIVVVDDEIQMEKVHAYRDQIPNLKAIIQTLPPYADYVKQENGYYKWSDLEEMTDLDNYNDVLETRIKNLKVDDCCTLVYTSGTVGNPKGVILTHENLTFTINNSGKCLPTIRVGDEIIVSYLPLNHVAGLIFDILLTMLYAATVHFAKKDALKGTLIVTIREVRPTSFLGVPRVFEKMQEKILTQLEKDTSRFRKRILDWARNVSIEHYLNMIDEGKQLPGGWQYRMAKFLVLDKIKAALGLDRCTTIIGGAAPLSVDVQKFFYSIDLPILEAFGMSETSGAHSLSNLNAFNLSSVGKPIADTETKVINQDEYGHGEICMRGKHIFKGYLKNEEKTKEALNSDGWLHTGDVGFVDEKGFLYVTGRIKELLITSGGENIPPIHIENLVKHQLPCLSNAFLIGDRRKFLTMLVTLKTRVDPNTAQPLDELMPDVINWLTEIGVNYTKLSEILAAGPCPKVMAAIQAGIDRANKSAISDAQKVKKFAILPHDFSIPTGELGPTLKVKRFFINDMYKDIIENFYKK